MISTTSNKSDDSDVRQEHRDLCQSVAQRPEAGREGDEVATLPPQFLLFPRKAIARSLSLRVLDAPGPRGLKERRGGESPCGATSPDMSSPPAFGTQFGILELEVLNGIKWSKTYLHQIVLVVPFSHIPFQITSSMCSPLPEKCATCAFLAQNCPKLEGRRRR